jgi:hypothetical protein
MTYQLTHSSPINKIIIVGHPLSGFQDVETLLNISGMKSPVPSRREGFLPTEISATLSKAHRTPIFNALHLNADIKQIDVGPVWNGMALDLLLGNIDQEFWGWADSQSVYLLDYWKSLDPQLAFVLVYDTPEQLVAQAFDVQTPLTPQALQQATDNWSAYNAALLHFYHRNPERCLLVHAQQVRESSNTYLQQMRTRIGAPVLTIETAADETDAVSDASEPTIEVQRHAAAPHNPHNALKAYIAHALTQQPDTLQLYEELQSVANLPLAEQIAAPYTPLDAWVSMTALQNQHTKQAAKAQQSTNEQQQENELILLQLHQVQEELDRHYLEGQQQQIKIKALTETEKLATERSSQMELAQKAKAEAEKNSQTKLAKEHAGQIEQINKQLATQTKLAQAQATQIKEAAAKPAAADLELTQENELMLLQLHQVQEELERYYLENQRLKAKPSAPAKPAAPYGAADRVKQQLSYQLGSKMIERSRSLSGWLGMPFSLIGVARQYKRDLPKRKAAKQVPIEKYRDAHEAERVKQHLSYRLGTVLIKHGKNPLRWPLLPFALLSARKAWKQTQ